MPGAHGRKAKIGARDGGVAAIDVEQPGASVISSASALGSVSPVHCKNFDRFARRSQALADVAVEPTISRVKSMV